MPIDYGNYPYNWRDISQRIRDRAGHKCEWPGCNAPHGAMILRSVEDPERYIIFDEQEAVYTMPDGTWIRMSEIPDEFLANPKEVRVVLTVAHLDHDTSNNDESNLRAWCQLHHLRYDAAHHAENAKATRLRKAEEQRERAGQVRLFR